MGFFSYPYYSEWVTISPVPSPQSSVVQRTLLESHFQHMVLKAVEWSFLSDD